MTIKEKGYIHWDGELSERRFPWWPIARYGIKLSFKKKFFKFIFFMTLIPAIVFLVGVYISERLEDFRHMIPDSPLFLKVNPAFFKTYFTNDFLLFMMILILVFVGSGLISDDLKHNSLQLYFSRPIKKKDYFIGKISIIAFFLFIMTLFSGLILFIMKIVFSGSFKFFAAYPWLPLSIIGYSLFLTGFFSLYALLFSSLSKNRRYVAILIFGLYFFSDILFGIFYGIFRNQYFSLLSLTVNLKQVGALFFKQKMAFSVPGIYSLLILTGFCTLAVFVLKKRVKGVQVVK
ncbi:ABC transporter permease [Acidobacteriota bacterium]